MKKQLFPALVAMMLCLPMTMQADVTHLLPKVHSLNVTNQPSFGLQRAVTITDVNNTVALKKVFTDYGCTIQDGASATITVQMVDKIEGAYDYALEGYDNEGYQLIVGPNALDHLYGYGGRRTILYGTTIVGEHLLQRSSVVYVGDGHRTL